MRSLLLGAAASAVLLAGASSASAQHSALSRAALSKSLALAEQVWHPGACGGVSLNPFRLADAADPDVDSPLGFALPERCRIEINWPLVKQYADSDAYIVDAKRTRQIWACTVIVHEVGHLAGYTDPVGAPILDASGAPILDDFTGQPLRDPRHSPNSHSVMYPYLRFTYPPCRKLFRATKAGHLRPDART